MQSSSFNLVTVVAALQKRWTTIVFFVLASIVIAGITVYLVPEYYKSTATVVSANPVLADKARLFNKNIRELYSYFGSGDDLDRIYGVAEMGTVYEKLADEFSMVNHYQLTGDSLSLLRRKAVKQLRKNIHLRKTDKDQLVIEVWTKDRQLSADIANRIVTLIEQTESRVWLQHYQQSVEKLKLSVAEKEQQYALLNDSLQRVNASQKELLSVQLTGLLEQLKQYRIAEDEFVLAIQTPPAVLYVLEAAAPAAKAERPDKLAILVATGLVSCLFICLLILVNDRKQPA